MTKIINLLPAVGNATISADPTDEYFEVLKTSNIMFYQMLTFYKTTCEQLGINPWSYTDTQWRDFLLDLNIPDLTSNDRNVWDAAFSNNVSGYNHQYLLDNMIFMRVRDPFGSIVLGDSSLAVITRYGTFRDILGRVFTNTANDCTVQLNSIIQNVVNPQYSIISNFKYANLYNGRVIYTYACQTNAKYTSTYIISSFRSRLEALIGTCMYYMGIMQAGRPDVAKDFANTLKDWYDMNSITIAAGMSRINTDYPTNVWSLDETYGDTKVNAMIPVFVNENSSNSYTISVALNDDEVGEAAASIIQILTLPGIGLDISRQILRSTGYNENTAGSQTISGTRIPQVIHM